MICDRNDISVGTKITAIKEFKNMDAGCCGSYLSISLELLDKYTKLQDNAKLTPPPTTEYMFPSLRGKK